MYAPLRVAKVEAEFWPFMGGLDLESSPLNIKKGRVATARNFECGLNSGYRRIAGYERFDGQTSPSSAAYAILNVDVSGSFSAGDTITGDTSGATAVVLEQDNDGTNDYLVITKISGTFQSGEDLSVGGNVQGETTSTATVDGASSPALHARYKNLAADEYRDDIAAVPGSGPVLGVFHHNDVVYAFRNNAGGTAADLYKSTSSGWTKVDLGLELEFSSGGTTEIEEGDTITGATSGATAVVKRVVLTGGKWSNGDAEGKLILASQTGNFQAEDLDVGASTNLATIAGDSDEIALDPGGTFEFVKANFGGAVKTKRVYGCDGVNRGFEFDGTVFVPIDTGMTDDAPTHLAAHKNHLFFSFGGSVQHSGIGTPYVWSPVTGASEIAMGDTVTGFAVQPGSADGGALAIYTRNRTSILYGSSSSDWNLVSFREELGAFERTIQDVGFTVFLDDRGLTSFRAAQEYGNFASSTISDDIRSFVNDHRIQALCSCISRDRSQYRIFFSDGTGLYVTVIRGKIVGLMPVSFPDTVRCIFSGEKNDGSEMIVFGSDDGWVFQMEKGTSFDGDAIEYFFETPYHFSGSPRVRKRYRGGAFEVTGNGYAEFLFSAILNYGDGDAEQDTAVEKTANLSTVGRWDVGTWDVGQWDGRTLTPTEFDLTGTGENISLRVAGSSDEFLPFTIHGVILHFTPRRALR